MGKKTFWLWALPTCAVLALFFAWELKLIDFPAWIPALPRAPATPLELLYSGALTLLLSISAGLFGWQRRYGSCPTGARSMAGLAGALGGLALLCPVCLVLPAGLIGFGTFFVLLAPFLPLLKLLALILAAFATWLLWPRR